jgi:hypothetical protein
LQKSSLPVYAPCGFKSKIILTPVARNPPRECSYSGQPFGYDEIGHTILPLRIPVCNLCEAYYIQLEPSSCVYSR